MATATLAQQRPVTAAAAAAAARPRLDSIDFVRGLVMVIMALDHVREFFHLDARLFEPTDLIRTTPLLFLTRWITHLCAPSFVFLAGTGAYLWASRGRSQAELTRFLVSRGLWLVVVELSLVTVGWTFNFTWSAIGLQVIWAIGWSMVVLAALARLPIRVVGAIGVVMIAGHNLLDAIHVKPLAVADRLSPDATAWDWAWSVLHIQNPPVIYPLIPWIGVMATGYAFGALVKGSADERRRLFLRLGVALTASFVVLRWVNIPAVVPQHQQVSAVAPVSAHDPWARDHAARPCGPGFRPSGAVLRGLRPGPVPLLHRSPLPDSRPRARRSRGNGPGRAQRPPGRVLGLPPELRLQPRRRVRDLGWRRARPVSAVPVVRRTEGPAEGGVAELRVMVRGKR